MQYGESIQQFKMEDTMNVGNQEIKNLKTHDNNAVGSSN